MCLIFETIRGKLFFLENVVLLNSVPEIVCEKIQILATDRVKDMLKKITLFVHCFYKMLF